MAVSWMTAIEAIAWIMFRDEAFAEQAKEMSLNRFSVALAMQDAQPTQTQAEARCVLVSECEGEQISATAIPGLIRDMGARKKVAATTFGDLRFGEHSGQLTLQTKDGSIATKCFRNPRFRRADVLRVFPHSDPEESAIVDEISLQKVDRSNSRLRIQPKTAAAQEGLKALQVELASEGKRLFDLSHKQLIPKLEDWCRAHDKPVPGNRVFRAVLATMRHSA